MLPYSLCEFPSLTDVFDFNASRQRARDSIRACLERSLSDVMINWIPRLQDEDFFPTFGQSIITEAKTGGFDNVFINLDYPGTNVGDYCSYRWPDANGQNGGFKNQVVVGPKAGVSQTQLASVLLHEFAHGAQSKHVPAMSAIVYNHQTNVLIHPRDLMILMAACEEHAHVIQAWGGHLLYQMGVERIHEVTRYDALSVETFQSILQEKNGNKPQALLKAVRVALGKALLYNTSNDPLKDRRFMNHYYYDLTLGNFDSGMNLRFKNGKMQEDLRFVRLEPEDILGVFESFGLGSVVDYEYSRVKNLLEQGPVLLPQTQKLLTQIEDRIGTPYSPSLPTLKEAVGDKCQFMQQFKPRVSGQNQSIQNSVPLDLAV